MKTLFLCGSLEPGRDGVGDYTRRLAGELIRQGHHASILSLNDCFIDTVLKTEQESDGTNVAVVRLPDKLSTKERYYNAENYITDFDPEWLSLQFVPYSFQKKGLPFGLGKRLAKIGKGRKWHVMFHELWVGMDKEAPLKHYWIGKIQKGIIRRLMYSLIPKCVHTQTSLYQLQLRKIRINATMLPLFGNIPVQYVRLPQFIDKNDNIFNMVIFGSIRHVAKIHEFANWIQWITQHSGKIININFIGENGIELKEWIKILAHNHIPYTIYGHQKTDVISKVLSESSLGLTTTPFLLIEKSGSVAAMLEHQLPILCLAKEWHSDINVNISLPVSVWNKDITLTDFFENNKAEYKINLKIVARKFINKLYNENDYEYGKS
jgi:hypothetical protein